MVRFDEIVILTLLREGLLVAGYGLGMVARLDRGLGAPLILLAAVRGSS